MVIAKQIEIRNNIKKYFDIAYEGDVVVVPRKGNKNVVIISEEEYSRLNQNKRIVAYADAFTKRGLSARSKNQANSLIDDNLEKLNMIENLKPGWNGHDAPDFGKELIEKVKRILLELYIQPEIFPTALQTIQLEFDNSRHDHMEIEIGASDTAEVFISLYNGGEKFESIPISSEEINHRVGAFYG